MDALVKIFLVLVAVVAAIAGIVWLTVMGGAVLTVATDEALRSILPVPPVVAWALLGLVLGGGFGLLRAGQVERVPTVRRVGGTVLGSVLLAIAVIGLLPAVGWLSRRSITGTPRPEAQSPLPGAVAPIPPPPSPPSPPSPPLVPYVEKEAHPFEGTRYGEWTVSDALIVYTAPSENAAALGAISPGERVVAATGETHTLQYGELVVTQPQTIVVALPGRDGYGDRGSYGSGGAASLTLDRGDRLYVVSCYGEGDCRYWFGGRFFDLGVEKAMRAWRPSSEKPLVRDWWCYVHTADGRSGWVRNPDPAEPIAAPEVAVEDRAPESVPASSTPPLVLGPVTPEEPEIPATSSPPEPALEPDPLEGPRVFRVAHRHRSGLRVEYCEGNLTLSRVGLAFVTVRSRDGRHDRMRVAYREATKLELRDENRVHVQSKDGKWDFFVAPAEQGIVWDLLPRWAREGGYAGTIRR